MQPLIMTTEELKFYYMGLIEVDGTSEEIFFSEFIMKALEVIKYEN